MSRRELWTRSTTLALLLFSSPRAVPKRGRGSQYKSVVTRVTKGKQQFLLPRLLPFTVLLTAPASGGSALNVPSDRGDVLRRCGILCISLQSESPHPHPLPPVSEPMCPCASQLSHPHTSPKRAPASQPPLPPRWNTVPVCSGCRPAVASSPHNNHLPTSPQLTSIFAARTTSHRAE